MITSFAPRFRASLAAILPLLAGAAPAAATSDAPDLIVVDATVITMDAASPRAQAFAIKDGRIVAVGGIEQVLALKGDSTRIRDLDGGFVLPGFVDPRGSCLAAGLSACALDLTGLSASDDSITQALAAKAKDAVTRRVGLVIGAVGESLPQGLTRERLDAALRDQPAIVMNARGRTILLNSKACELAGLDASAGGPLEGERAARAWRALVASLSVESRASILLAGQESLAARGYTTVAEGSVDEATHAAFVRLAAARRMALDVVAFADGDAAATPACLASPWKSDTATNGYRVAGVSITLDRELADAIDAPATDRLEDAVLPSARTRDVVMAAFDAGWQLMAEAHGRDAIGRFVEVILEVAASKGPVDRRPMLIGADLAGPEHFASLAEPRVGVVFGPGRLAMDGDRLRDAMTGEDDPERLSPAATALSHRLTVAFHSSVGVADPLRVIAAAVGRRTASGDILGPRERVTVEQALAAVSIDAARVLGEEARVGSIKIGKRADLVILSGDPLKAGSADLRVIETMKGGRTVHEQNGSAPPLRRRPGAAWVTAP